MSETADTIFTGQMVMLVVAIVSCTLWCAIANRRLTMSLPSRQSRSANGMVAFLLLAICVLAALEVL